MNVAPKMYGVRVQRYQIILLIVLVLVTVACLGVIAYCFRRKSQLLKKKIDGNVSYR